MCSLATHHIPCSIVYSDVYITYWQYVFTSEAKSPLLVEHCCCCCCCWGSCLPSIDGLWRMGAAAAASRDDDDDDDDNWNAFVSEACFALSLADLLSPRPLSFSASRFITLFSPAKDANGISLFVSRSRGSSHTLCCLSLSLTLSFSVCLLLCLRK